MASPSPKEIREKYSDFMDAWREIQEEGRTDMRYVGGDPWDPEDRKAREDAGRPCISLDEINQYINQYIANLRENKRTFICAPKGDGANDEDAGRRENLMRGIEDDSNAQEAHITAGENAVMRGYGYSRLRTEYQDGESFEQVIRIERIANPDCVLLDPDYKKADGSDVEGVFLTDLLKKADFKRKYPKAKTQSFSTEMDPKVQLWARENHIQVAEFWQVHKTPRKLLLIDTPAGPEAIFEDEMREFLDRIGETAGRIKGKFVKLRDQVKVIKERSVDERNVVQYITNGLEIMEENPWAGSRIPICACFGKEIYLDDGSGSKRMLFSMTRLARDPQMLNAYLRSQQAEEAGMAPRAPFVGYKGQFESDADAWEWLNKIPRSFVQIDPVVDASSGTVLPPPSRPAFEPNLQAYEVALESTRRAIQAAMGINPLPTPLQRNNEKSGVAIERIKDAEDRGTFQFADNYDRYLRNMGWQVNELIDVIYDTARTVPVVQADGTRAAMRINDPQYEVMNPDEDHLHVVDDSGEPKAKFDVTIDTGPSYQSQREAQSEFVDKLITEMGNLPIPPQIGTKILAKAIRMKADLGVIAKEIADLLDPPDANQLPPAAQAVVANMQAQLQALTQENQALHMDRAGRVMEQQTKLQIEQMKGEIAKFSKNMDYITRVVTAQLAAKSKASDTEAQADAAKELALLGFDQEHHQQAHEQAHELAIGQQQHEQAKELADQNAQAALTQQAQAAAQQPAQ